MVTMKQPMKLVDQSKDVTTETVTADHSIAELTATVTVPVTVPVIVPVETARR
jgi:hypothetical protein